MKFDKSSALISFYLFVLYFQPAWAEQVYSIPLFNSSFDNGFIVAKHGNKNDPVLADHLNPKKLFLRSSSALIFDKTSNSILYGKNTKKKMPIASITKLMTAMIVLDSNLPLNKSIRITSADKDRIRYSKSRLRFGSKFSRGDLLEMALVASENRAASAIARTFPKGKKAFVNEMNKKAAELGMKHTKFVDATGIRKGNVSTAGDLVKLLNAAYTYPLIKEISTSKRKSALNLRNKKQVKFSNTNRLLKKNYWDIELSKTGFTNDSGYCLTMISSILDRPMVMIFLNSWGKLSKYGDANRARKWLINSNSRRLMHSKI